MTGRRRHCLSKREAGITTCHSASAPSSNLYRLADDPQCLQNLADYLADAGDIRQLRMQNWKRGCGQISIRESWATGRSSTPTSTWAAAAEATTKSCERGKRKRR